MTGNRLAEQTDPRSRFYLEMMQRGEDNVYAVGLHKALQALESLTPLEIANYLTESGRLPE